jgi:thiol-disulfide isomerase/thioredoxin
MRALMMVCLLLVLPVTAHAALSFKLTDTAGDVHRLADYQGKWVIVNYWATWCPPCLEEVPDLVNLYDQRRGKDVMVIGVVFEFNNIDEVEKFVDDMLMSYPVVLGNVQVAAEIGPAEILPTTYIYNPRGELVKIRRGLITRQYIEDLIAGKVR